jgi:hypothetical protein
MPRAAPAFCGVFLLIRSQNDRISNSFMSVLPGRYDEGETENAASWQVTIKKGNLSIGLDTRRLASTKRRIFIMRTTSMSGHSFYLR